MKRELKGDLITTATGDLAIARLIPMKRELKAFGELRLTFVEEHIARLIPMKRELKEIIR